ncbi:hypothetical protein CAPTEDRAFT_156303 [Capitella teleta]|uniref:Uncharacterized protein n=1 Tax=Capitella teleta TaxID=283909 RepID=R7USP9_CAPTE|nr:hypothetical protein CAPTEDRAFT_156303 [Capitella teleta]|eukprot:ELU09524.1 hypothetical protein CAPTEDRAFT_156303 [Capitella teleta]
MDFDGLNPAVDPWKPLDALRQRELGFHNRMSATDLFKIKAGASLNLVKRLELFTTLDGHEGCVNALHFNQAGNLLASGSDDLSIIVWDWACKRKAFSFDSGHRSNVFQCKFMPFTGDCHLVSCARDGMIRLAELSSMGSCKSTRRLAAHRGAAHKLALLEDSSHVLYSCGEDGAMFEIDLREDKPNKLGFTKENNSRLPLYSIHANPSKSHEYCVGGRDHFLRVYDKRMINEENQNNGVMKKFCPRSLLNESEIKANVTCAVYSHNGDEILATYNDEDIYLFDSTHSDGADYIHKYFGHRNNQTVKGVNFYGPHSEFIVSGSDCSNIFIWDKETENVVQYFHGDDGGVVNVLEPHPTCPILATSGLDHDVKVWAPSAQEATTLQGLKRVIRRNRKERREERVDRDPDMLDSRMLWILQNLRRLDRRRMREEGEEGSSHSDTDSAHSANSDDEGPVSCAPS